MALRFILFLSLFVHSATAAPSVGGSALFLFQDSNFHKEDTNPASPDESPNGLSIQELELKLNAEVDLNTELNFVFSIHSHYESDGAAIEETWKFEPEEVFAENKSFSSVLLKVGKFKALLGKHNTLHTHAFPFVDATLIHRYLLGDEGLNDIGVSTTVRLPLSWQSEITLHYLRGKGENEQFNSPRPGDGVGLTHWKNSVNLSHATSLELGASLASGTNSFRRTTSITGADLTLKWIPTESDKNYALTWSTEYLSQRQQSDMVDDEIGSGLASWVQYQISPIWSALYRYDSLIFENSLDPAQMPNERWNRNSIGAVYTISEFSLIKLQISRRHGGIKGPTGDDTENSFFLQMNLTMDSHSGHSH